MNRLPAALAAAVLLLGAAGCSPEPARVPPAASAPAPAAPTPTFAEVHRGDTESVVKLHRFDPRARAVVVEPTVFLQGPDFCAAFHLPGTDPRCDRAWATEDSRVKVTLPVSADAELLSIRDGSPECLDDRTGAGTCRWPASALAGRVSADEGGLLVRLTTKDGTATRIAEVYVP
ncbi:hypothetical protein [Actinoplanes sp. NPDC049599]|uniref:hypothetical protein n=1 Tax=Actinoplanes sp. NPDC049599 TaxID=3363903 RepID=UPI00378BB062